ncbi:MAG: hypothetical protein A2162_09970 [Deltaproteobacteria bacterium RBG_13_52_11b]|nr:MAG: hypothetical protein A2162_09970 [Deltaproteobacteria bacterium RBG_13_52_11b]
MRITVALRLLIPFLLLLLYRQAMGETTSISIRYEPTIPLPGLQEKLGRTLGLAPSQDKRQRPLYVGHHTPLRGSTLYLKSDPFPLEDAIEKALAQTLPRYGVNTVPVSDWDGQADSLPLMEVDSVLTIEVRKCWVGGWAISRRTKVKASISIIIHLGIKKERTVFTSRLFGIKETTLSRWTPRAAGETLNEILTEVLDSFLANPYGTGSSF